MYGLGTLFAGLLLRKRGATATLLLGVAALFLALIGSAAGPRGTTCGSRTALRGTAVSLVFVVGTAVPQEMFAKTNHLGLIAALVSIGIPAGFSVAVPLLKHSFRERGWSRTWQYFAVAEAGCILVGALFATPFLCPRERARRARTRATAATAPSRHGLGGRARPRVPGRRAVLHALLHGRVRAVRLRPDGSPRTAASARRACRCASRRARWSGGRCSARARTSSAPRRHGVRDGRRRPLARLHARRRQDHRRACSSRCSRCASCTAARTAAAAA